MHYNYFFLKQIELRFLVIFDREAKGVIEFFGMNLIADNANTRDIFDWVQILFEQAVLEAAGAIKTLEDS
jgi:hypothetical protein